MIDEIMKSERWKMWRKVKAGWKWIDNLTKIATRKYHFFLLLFFTLACESNFYTSNSDKPYYIFTWHIKVLYKIYEYKWILIPAHLSWWNNNSWIYEFVYVFVNPTPVEYYIPLSLEIYNYTSISTSSIELLLICCHLLF